MPIGFANDDFGEIGPRDRATGQKRRNTVASLSVKKRLRARRGGAHEIGLAVAPSVSGHKRRAGRGGNHKIKRA